MAKYITEFIGTYFLVLTVGLTVVGGVEMAPLAIGGMLMVMVYMGGHISGAHYNPAITVAVWMRGKIEAAQVVPYMVAQLLGATAAAGGVYMITGRAFAPAPGADVSAMTAVGVEVLFTLALALVMLNSATAKATEGNSFYGLAIGFTLTVAVFAGGPISGGAFNPAVGLGPILMSVATGNGTLGNAWIYAVGPVAGAAVAALIFKAQHEAN